MAEFSILVVTEDETMAEVSSSRIEKVQNTPDGLWVYLTGEQKPFRTYTHYADVMRLLLYTCATGFGLDKDGNEVRRKRCESELS